MTRARRHIRDFREAFLSGIGIPEKSEFKPDNFQMEAIESVIAKSDTLVVAPTGAGKTFIAVEGIRRVLQSGARAIYTAPLKALSNAKYSEFRHSFEPQFRVGLLTGDRKIDVDADVVVATTEIYRNDLYSGRANYSLVVLDEIHYLADPQRGPVWEESIVLSPASATLLMLSASISNPREIAQWIEEVRGRPVSIICVRERPVDLRYGFLHPDYGVVPLVDEHGRLNAEVSQCSRGFCESRGGNRQRGNWGGRRRR